MQIEQNIRIGLIIDVTGEYFTARLVSESAGPASDRASAMKGERVGQVGSYLAVKQSGFLTLAMVERSYSVADRQGHAVNMARLVPLGELSQQGVFTKGVSRFPNIGDEIQVISHDQLKRIFSAHSDPGYKIGHLTSFESIDVHLDASAFFGRHVAILGQSGSGKSWTVTSLIQSALRSMPGAHMVLLDMHGEYCQKEVDGIAISSPFPPGQVRSMNAHEIEFPYWLLTYAELCDLIVDPADENASIQISFLRSILMRLKRDTNKHLDLGHITVDSPVYYSMEEFTDLIKQTNSETTNFGKTVSPLNGKFNQMLVRLYSMLNDTRYDFLMKPKIRTSTESLTDMMEDIVGLGEPKANVTVLDLSAVPFDVVPMVTAQIGRLAFEFNFWNPLCREFPIFLICEEAHEYIPREDIPRFREARRSMERTSNHVGPRGGKPDDGRRSPLLPI